MNQHERILKYIDDFGSISPFEAFMELGITKLATRVSEMIRDGEKITKKPESSRNRYGQKVNYVRYSRQV
jgi:hypothetical protein